MSYNIPKQYLELDSTSVLSAGAGVDLHLYNSDDGAGNYERLEVKWDTNVAEIRAAAAGTGTVRDLKIFAGANGTSSAPTYTFEGDTDMGMYKAATTQLNFTVGGNYGLNLGAGVMAVSSNIGIGWRSAQNLGQGTAYNTLLFRESTGVIGQYNSVFDAPQAFNIYNTWTDASNYERLELKWDTNVAYVGPTQAGTGSGRDMVLTSGRGTSLGHIELDYSSGFVRFKTGATTTKMYVGASGTRINDSLAPNIDSDASAILGETTLRFANTYTDTITIGDGVDAILTADADNELALRNGTNGQAFHVYGTYTDASNYERLVLYHDGSNAVVGSEAAGTGSVAALRFATSGTNRFLVDSSGNLLPTAAQTYSFGSASQTFLGVFANSLTVGPYFSQSKIESDAANDLALRNGTNPQEFRIYNTYTDASNYERLEFKWDSNVASIGTTAAGTGTGRALDINAVLNISFTRNGQLRYVIGGTFNQFYAEIRPATDSLYSNGTDALRWSNTYTDGIATNVETFTATDTLDLLNQVCLCNATTGNITLNLPVASSTPSGTQYQIKKIDSSSNTVIITPNSGGGDLIDGSATYTLSNQWEGVIIVCDGGDWYVTGGVTNSGGGGGGGGGLGGGD